MAAWMRKVHGDTTLISTDYRPVPLKFHYFDGRNLTSLLRRSTVGDHRPKVDPRTRRTLRRGELMAQPDALVQELAEQEMLPAIYFVFSRQGCDAAMLSCAHLQLLSAQE